MGDDLRHRRVVVGMPVYRVVSVVNLLVSEPLATAGDAF